MKPAPFEYVAPASIEDACNILADAGGGATVIAGGQSLMPLLNLRMSQPFLLVDIGRIAGLSGIESVGGGLRVGPMTRQRDALDNSLLAQALPVMAQALGHIGHHQTRNRGTIGGSIALGEPAAEMPATAVALGATLELRSSRGTRRIPAREFYLGPYMTALEPDELLVAIEYPSWPSEHITLFREVSRRPGDFALVGLVGALVVEDGCITRAGIAWFGMGATPIAATSLEEQILGQRIVEIDPEALARFALAECAPFDDQHASADYRRTVAGRIFTGTLVESLDLRETA